MSATPLRRQIGQLMLVGLAGAALEPAERAWLRLLRPSGFVLFRRNIEAAGETTRLLREATDAAAGDDERVPALRALDLEGGLVDRLRDLLAPLPSAAAVAHFGSARDARRHGELIGRAARLLGFNAVFAPVLDLALPPALPVMRTRVYGATPEAVVRYARPFLAGLKAERVLGTGKHFPGLGGGTLDSHHATPRIDRTWAQLWNEDIAPYRELLPGLPLVMVAHAVYSRVSHAGGAPASVSRFWLHDVLRRRMNFEGLIVSDDMEMGGLLAHMPIEDAAVQAIVAGADLLEICRDPALIFRAYEALLREAERSMAFRRVVRRAAERVVKHKQRLLHAQLPRDATQEQLTRLRREIGLYNAEIEALERSPRPGRSEA